MVKNLKLEGDVKMRIKFAVLGAGSFGIALCKLISRNVGFEVVLWSAVEEEIVDLLKNGESKKFLPGIALNQNMMKLTTKLSEISDADIVVFAVASKFVRDVANRVKNFLKRDCIVVNIAKGLEEHSFKRMSQVILDVLGKNQKFAVLSGPSHAEEIAKLIPTTVVVAATTVQTAEYLQKILSSSIFRIYVSDDMVGVELGGALKNPIALAVGICDGLKLGENVKAALMTRGIAEIGRLGVKLGAKARTFAGLSGVGDLIVTCTSFHSRNKRAGILIGQGKSVLNALNEVNMAVEGYLTTKVVFELSKKCGVSMPIINGLYEVLYYDKSAKSVMFNLMNRPVKHEYEKMWFD